MTMAQYKLATLLDEKVQSELECSISVRSMKYIYLGVILSTISVRSIDQDIGRWGKMQTLQPHEATTKKKFKKVTSYPAWVGPNHASWTFSHLVIEPNRQAESQPTGLKLFSGKYVGPGGAFEHSYTSTTLFNNRAIKLGPDTADGPKNWASSQMYH